MGEGKSRDVKGTIAANSVGWGCKGRRGSAGEDACGPGAPLNCRRTGARAIMGRIMTRRPFVYCPYCATPLQDLHYGHKTLRACPNCRFVQHHDPKVAVVASIEHDNCLLLVRRGVNPSKGLWALPGGYMDAAKCPSTPCAAKSPRSWRCRSTCMNSLPSIPWSTMRGPARASCWSIGPRLQDALCSTAVAPPALDDVAEARWFTVQELAGELPVTLAFASTEVEVRRWVAGPGPLLWQIHHLQRNWTYDGKTLSHYGGSRIFGH